MNNKILHLIDFEKVNKLLEGFNKSTGFVTAILDLQGNVLSASGWRQACTQFHRVNSETSQRCTISDTVLSSKLAQGEKYHFYKCLNGLVDVAVPIIINGEHIANLFSGQFFFEQPDLSFFENQAATYGFPLDEYLKSISEIPIVDEEKVKTAMDFLLDMTQLISEITHQRLEEMELNAALKKSQEQLFESEFKFNRFYENGPFGMIITDKNLKFKKANPTICNILGYTEQELQQLSFVDISHPDDLIRDLHYVKQLINREIEVYKVEKRYIRSDGKTIWGALTLNSTYDYDGNFLYVLGVIEDITSKKMVQEALELSEAMYRNVFESAVIGMYRTTPDGKILMANPTLIKMLGFNSFEDISQRNLEEEGFETNTFRDRFRKLIEENGSLTAYESIWKTQDGRSLYISENAKAFRNSSGEVIYYEGTIEDITARKQAEMELIEAKVRAEESEEKYKQIFDNTFDIMSIYEVTEDNRFKVITFNHAEEKLIGKVEEFRDKYIDESIPPELYEQFKVNYERCIKEEKLIIYEEDISYLHINKTFLTQLIPLKNQQGRVHRIIVISRDITDIKELNKQLTAQNNELKMLNLDLVKAKEKAEESDKLKTAFINNISHEIRTPLNSILGFGQFLSDFELPQDQRKEYFSIIRNSSNRLMNTIADYMEMAKIVSGTVDIRMKDFALIPFLEEIKTSAQNMFPDHRNKLNCLIPQGAGPVVLNSDIEYIRRVLYILLENAQKFTNNGLVNFGYHERQGFIQFFVEDTGTGVSPEKLQVIFGMFAQENPSNTSGYEGSGLGLSIAQGLVKLLGGKIEVSSVKGNGAKFWFTIPHSIVNEKISDDYLNSTENSNLSKPLILIAEDDEANQLYLETILKIKGLDFIIVKNGAEAVEACRKNDQISLVLMDIKMPMMNGIEATQKIREFKPTIPIIALTAYAQKGDEDRFIAAGCNGYLAKPVMIDALLEKIKYYGN